MSYSLEDWQRVDQVLEAARLRLSPPVGWKEVALKARLSVEGIRMIRRGLVDDPRSDNLAKIEAALRLPLGTIANVLKDPDFTISSGTAEPEQPTEPEPEPEDPLVAELMARDDGLTRDGAVAAAVIIRAYRKRGNSPDQSKREA
jgi:hypothetical protein